MPRALLPPQDRYVHRIVLALRVASARCLIGMTQDELAERVGVSRGQISTWEAGGSAPPVALLPRIADVLQLPVVRLAAAPGEDCTDMADAAHERALAAAAAAAHADAVRDGGSLPPASALASRVKGGGRPRRGRPPRQSAPTTPRVEPAADAAPEAMPASAQSVSRRWTERHGEADVREDPAGGEGREPWAGYADAHDRVRAMLRPSPTDTHGIAWRDVERYWHLLDELREPVLTSRVRLDEATARALAPSLPHLADPRAATPADAWKRIQTWVTADAGEIPAGVRAYFERVLRLPPLAALLCVDGVERARDRRDDEATRVKVLLDLLGPPDWE